MKVQGKFNKRTINSTSVNLTRKHRVKKGDKQHESNRKAERQSDPKIAVKHSKVFLSGEGEDDSSNPADLDAILETKIR